MPDQNKELLDQIKQNLDKLRNILKEKAYAKKEQIKIIKEIGSKRSWHIIEPLSEFMNEEICNPFVKTQILDQLSRIMDPRVISILNRYVNDEDRKVRTAAIKGLSKHSDPKCIPALINALNDEDKWIRVFGINGLIKNPSKKAVREIIKLLADPEKIVKEEANSALNRIDRKIVEEEILNSLDTDNRLMKISMAALIGSKKIKKGIDKLLEFSKSNDRRLSLVATRALEKIGDIKVIPALIEISAEKVDNDNYINRSIISIANNRGNNAVRNIIELYKTTEDSKIKNTCEYLLKKLKKYSVDLLTEIIPKEENEEIKEELKNLLYNI